ncbi:TVP38/TMEM64 family protein [Alkalicoccus chagannorensis]|uniref:TVP38/TMEM64 family protein n=1 Tax=Alkalicoccus chagannorensis TaxID=427072 RepID=UPI00047E1588|nr:TVP38/TMEM64 family protein [Alkalicoccus chagannorensis]
MSKQMLIKGGAAAAVIGILLFVNWRWVDISPEMLRSFMDDAGVFAPMLYIVLYTLRPLILFPASILSLAGGLLFGAFWGTVLIVIGATAGAVLSFVVARRLGKNIAGREWKGKARTMQHQMEENGLLYVLLVRLIPVFNFDMISYLAGISKVKLKDFLFGTLFGIIPGAFAYSFLGASVVEGDIGIIFAAAAVFVAVSVIPVFFKKKLKKKTGTEEEELSHENV